VVVLLAPALFRNGVVAVSNGSEINCSVDRGHRSRNDQRVVTAELLLRGGA